MTIIEKTIQIAKDTMRQAAEVETELKNMQQEQDAHHVYAPAFYTQKCTALAEKKFQIDLDGQRALQKVIDAYKESVSSIDLLRGDELNDDMKLLGGNISLSQDDLTAIFDRASTRTMKTLAVRYAQEHRMEIPREFYTGAQKSAAAENLKSLYSNLTYRPELTAGFESDEYIKGAFPEIVDDPAPAVAD